MENVQGICSRCGQALKYPVLFRGQVYGSDCVATVLGMKVDRLIIRDGVVDEQAMTGRAKSEADQVAEYRKSVEDHAAKVARMVAAYQWLIEALEPTVSGIQFDAVNGAYYNGTGKAAAALCSLKNGMPLLDQSDWQIRTAKEAYCSLFGRRNSKAYDAAMDELEAKLETMPRW